MSRFHKVLILIAGLALVVFLAAYWMAKQELQTARRELSAVIKANQFLKQTLGDMTIAITSKDKEIHRLKYVSCNGQEKTVPGVPAGLERRNVSEPDAGHKP